MRPLSTTSRYQSASTRVSAGNEFFTPLFKRPTLKVVGERLHIVTKSEENRPDLIAYATLGDPSAWWVIMEYNKVVDPMTLLEGDNLRVPLYTMTFQPKDTLLTSATEVVGDASSPPLSMLITSPLPTVASGVVEPVSYLYLYNFQVENCLTGRVHYEIQIALDRDFRILLIGKLSALSLERWYYLKSNGYQEWPASGVDGASSGGLSAYFSVLGSDPLVKGGTYYARLRNVIDDQGILTYGPWFGTAFTIPA